MAMISIQSVKLEFVIPQALVESESWLEPNLLELQELVRMSLDPIIIRELVAIMIGWVCLLEVGMDDYSLKSYLFLFLIFL